MTAKEMFKKIGYECLELPLKILYKQPEWELGGHTPYVLFNLANKKWDTNIVDVDELPVQDAINQQCKELGWIND